MMWTMAWTREGAERAIEGAARHEVDFIEIPLPDLFDVDGPHIRSRLASHKLRAIRSLVLPERA